MIKNRVMKKISFLLVLVTMLSLVMPAMAYQKSEIPTIDPQPVPHVDTEDEFFNVLLAGIDLGNYSGLWASGGKRVLENCHADVVMVASVNKTKNTVSLVSLPRDTFVNVPGVRGVYKLNAAINCADNVNDGMQRLCDTATWLLGGIQIDRFVAVDMTALIKLVDAIGGVEFDMDMDYKGHSGIQYKKGVQVLDGVGVMDYVRARKNAGVEANDIGRTRRGRDMITAIFDKVQQNLKTEGIGGMTMSLINLVFGNKLNIITNMTMADLFSMADIAMNLGDAGQIGSYVLEGQYKLAMKYWNFTFTNQDHRKEVLREVYGIEVEELPYVSFKYAEYLLESGHPMGRQILIARQLLDYGATQNNLTSRQQKALEDLEAAHDRTVLAFDTYAKSQDFSDYKKVNNARMKLRECVEEASMVLKYLEDFQWNTGNYWYRDPLVNEYYEVDWR